MDIDRSIQKYNLHLFDKYSCSEEYQIPIIKNNNYIPKDLIGFNYSKTNKSKSVGIHFFLQDYQFERVWNKPYSYIEIFKKYDCILSPDFSLYIDMPLPMKIWNVYRNRLIGQYYQNCGIKVIPTISWGDKDTYDFCFDGIPDGSIVAISTIGCIRNKEAKRLWKDGVTEMIKRINPSTILIYGNKIDYDFKNINVVYYKNNIVERFDKLKENAK